MGEFAADLYYCKLSVDFGLLVYENNRYLLPSYDSQRSNQIH